MKATYCIQYLLDKQKMRGITEKNFVGVTVIATKHSD